MNKAAIWAVAISYFRTSTNWFFTQAGGNSTYTWVNVEIHTIGRERCIFLAVDEEIVDPGITLVEIGRLRHGVLQRSVDHWSVKSLVLFQKLMEYAASLWSDA